VVRWNRTIKNTKYTIEKTVHYRLKTVHYRQWTRRQITACEDSILVVYDTASQSFLFPKFRRNRMRSSSRIYGSEKLLLIRPLDPWTWKHYFLSFKVSGGGGGCLDDRRHVSEERNSQHAALKYSKFAILPTSVFLVKLVDTVGKEIPFRLTVSEVPLQVNVRTMHIRRSKNDQKYALTVPLLYSIYWLLRFGSSLPSSGSFLDPSELLEVQIEWVVS
jgi:hypothetical protein